MQRNFNYKLCMDKGTKTKGDSDGEAACFVLFTLIEVGAM